MIICIQGSIVLKQVKTQILSTREASELSLTPDTRKEKFLCSNLVYNSGTSLIRDHFRCPLCRGVPISEVSQHAKCSIWDHNKCPKSWRCPDFKGPD